MWKIDPSSAEKNMGGVRKHGRTREKPVIYFFITGPLKHAQKSVYSHFLHPSWKMSYSSKEGCKRLLLSLKTINNTLLRRNLLMRLWIVIYNCILCLLNWTLPIISFQPMVPPTRIWRGTSDNSIRRNYWTFHLRSFAKTECQKNTLGSQQRETAEMSSGIITLMTLGKFRNEMQMK